MPPWWILEGVTPEGPSVEEGTWTAISFTPEQQAIYGILADGTVVDQARHDAAFAPKALHTTVRADGAHVCKEDSCSDDQVEHIEVADLVGHGYERGGIKRRSEERLRKHMAATSEVAENIDSIADDPMTAEIAEEIMHTADRLCRNGRLSITELQS